MASVRSSSGKVTIRQRRKEIKTLAQGIESFLNDIEEYCGMKKPFALSEEEFVWIGRTRDYAQMLAQIDINEKPK